VYEAVNRLFPGNVTIEQIPGLGMERITNQAMCGRSTRRIVLSGGLFGSRTTPIFAYAAKLHSEQSWNRSQPEGSLRLRTFASKPGGAYIRSKTDWSMSMASDLIRARLLT
jgi:hypothetical protein